MIKKPNQAVERLSADIPRNLKWRVAAKAKLSGMTLTEAVIMLFEEYVKDFAVSDGALEDEDEEVSALALAA